MEKQTKQFMQHIRAVVLRTAVFLLLAAGILLAGRASAYAAEALNTPLDGQNPVYFYGDRVVYGGTTISLDSSNIYLDGSLSDEVCSQYDYVYNDFVKAYNAGAIKSGTESAPMNVWIAPNVYWMDDPDDPAIRDGVNGDNTPYALWMNVSYLSLNGLTDKPENVVFAVNRGHGAGATGNYTMFFINGQGTHTQNMTFGNYCCMDLVYPLDTTKNRVARQAAITQSQLILTNGSKITADNCNFNSRLNSCPFVGGTRILFTDCHFECTDDSLPTSAVYVDCDFEFYSSKPFYNTSGTGSVMLGCDFKIMHKSSQYLTKAGGVVTIIDGTFYSSQKDQYIGWTPDPSPALRCYAGNISVHYDYTDAEGEAHSDVAENYVMDRNAPYDNVDITDSSAMRAYRLDYNGNVVYNVYNLLKGSDDWDPLGQKEMLEAAEAAGQTEYTDVAVMLSCSPSSASITSGSQRKISTVFQRFSGGSLQGGKITWTVEDSLKDYITVTDNGDGSCTLDCRNETFAVAKGMVYATDESGLSAGVYVTASPQTLPAPSFTGNPTISLGNGRIALNYSLSYAQLDDYSDITWYRSSDAAGSNKIAVAVSQNDMPLKSYTLNYGDIGYYLIAVITPKQQCTYAGSAVTIATTRKITGADVKSSPFFFETDFSDFAYAIQNDIIPGFWLSDTYKDWLEEGDRYAGTTPWKYALGHVSSGSEGLYGLLPVSRGARLIYTPVKGSYDDMNVVLVFNPEKTAGQGFGSAGQGQYLNVYIKYDAATQTGYGLHMERISDCGVSASLVRFDNGTMKVISSVVNTSAFNAECTVTLSVTGKKLNATVTTTHAQSEKQANNNLQHRVDLTADITGNKFGGVGFIFTGTVSEGNRVMFNKLSVNWEGTLASEEQEQQKETVNKEPVKAPKKGTTFTNKKIKYKITNAATNGKGTVTVIGASKKTVTSLSIGATVTYKGITYKVTAIKAGAFKNYKKLKKVTIGKNVKKIGKQAFYKCKKLKKVTIKTSLLTKKRVGSKAFAKLSSTAKFYLKVSAKKSKAYKKILKKRGVTGKKQQIK